MSEEEERAYCEAALSAAGIDPERTHVAALVRLRAEAFEAGRKSRDADVEQLRTELQTTKPTWFVTNELATCKAKLALVEAAADTAAIAIERVMLANNIPLTLNQFAVCQNAAVGVRAALADRGEKL